MSTSNEQESLDLILYKLESLEDKFNEIEGRLEKIESYLQRQKGFIGGILFIGSCLMGAASLIKAWWK